MNLPEHIQQKETLKKIMEEGSIIADFLKTPAWELIERTILAQIENYKSDCYDAAKDTTKNIGNFLGRMESLEDLLRIIRVSYADAAENASKQLEATIKQETEQAEIDQGTTDMINAPMAQSPGTV